MLTLQLIDRASINLVKTVTKMSPTSAAHSIACISVLATIPKPGDSQDLSRHSGFLPDGGLLPKNRCPFIVLYLMRGAG
jgi:hypothetical protein